MIRKANGADHTLIAEFFIFFDDFTALDLIPRCRLNVVDEVDVNIVGSQFFQRVF